MSGRGRMRTTYRWGVLLFTAIVWVRCFGEARLEEFGWQFRLIEVWAMSASLVSAAFMVRLSMGWSRSRHASFAAAACVLNAVVLALHLGPLGILAPPAPSWHAVSLHLIAPVLQIADAVLILGAFERLHRAVAWTLGAAVTYVGWVELAVRPLNASIEGQGGLPYAGLDAMTLTHRLGLYAAVTVFGLALLPGFWVLQRKLRGEGAETGGGDLAI